MDPKLKDAWLKKALDSDPELRMHITDTPLYGCGWINEQGRWVEQVRRSTDNLILLETVGREVTIDRPVEDWPSQAHYDHCHKSKES